MHIREEITPACQLQIWDYKNNGESTRYSPFLQGPPNEHLEWCYAFFGCGDFLDGIFPDSSTDEWGVSLDDDAFLVAVLNNRVLLAVRMKLLIHSVSGDADENSCRHASS
jgi:hypothetical protein